MRAEGQEGEGCRWEITWHEGFRSGNWEEGSYSSNVVKEAAAGFSNRQCGKRRLVRSQRGAQGFGLSQPGGE